MPPLPTPLDLDRADDLKPAAAGLAAADVVAEEEAELDWFHDGRGGNGSVRRSTPGTHAIVKRRTWKHV